MNIQVFELWETLPDLNWMKEAAQTVDPRFARVRKRKNLAAYSKYADAKRGWDFVIAQKAKRELIPIKNRAVLIFHWLPRKGTRGVDPDNRAAGVKFILDGFQKAGILKNDSRKWIGALCHVFPEGPDPRGSGVIVQILEKEPGKGRIMFYATQEDQEETGAKG